MSDVTRVVAPCRLSLRRGGGEGILARLRPYRDMVWILGGRMTKTESRLDVEFRGELGEVTDAWLRCRADGMRVESLSPVRTIGA